MHGGHRYLVNFKRSDYVDVVVDASILKGMPYSFYSGRTGVVVNVNRSALGVDMTKIVGNLQIPKRIHVHAEYLRKSRCNEDFLKRVKANDQAKRDAKLKGEPVACKRQPV